MWHPPGNFLHFSDITVLKSIGINVNADVMFPITQPKVAFSRGCDCEEPSIYSNWSPLKRFRRRTLSPLFRIADTGILGLTPLRTHILICGFPRSGTTLLQLMLENGLPTARRFGREVGGWRAATYCWRNHELLISKVPRYYRAFRRERLAPDVLEVRYEHLVRDTADEQLRIEQFTGERAQVPFDEFHTVRRPDFDTSTLNGLRPLDQSPLAR